TQAPPVSSPTPSTPGYPRPGWSRAEPFPSAHPAALARSAAACWYTRRRAPSALPHRFLPRKILAQPQPPYPSRTLLDCAYAGLTEWRISAFSRFGLANRRRIAHQIFLSSFADQFRRECRDVVASRRDEGWRLAFLHPAKKCRQ